MNLLKCISIIGAVALLAVSPQTSTAGDTSRDTNSVNGSASSNAKDADNTGRNVRDRSDSTLTPGDQGNSKEDIQMTKNIRRSLTSDHQLSTLAKNIKIITVNGKTTLRGPVNTQQEKQAIETAAKKAGANNLDNQLEIKTNNH